ncbi:biopolymer transporter ExbD [bacterium SCSIO 12643]|nr:biopolymer transporter ExbD [bacterium SCSIO 12643]
MAVKGRNKVSPEFNMSSMTDIVFLLLVFFIIASTMISPNGVDVLLPKGSTRTTKKNQVSVSITKDLKYYVGQREVKFEQLERTLQSMLEGEEKPGFLLRPEETVDVQYVVSVMEIANRNKYQMVLATRGK